MFYIPGCREICLWLGAIDASRHVAENQLENGRSLFVYPVRASHHTNLLHTVNSSLGRVLHGCGQGGSREIFHTTPTSKETVLEITHRTGFVKLALRYGTPLVCSSG